MLYDVVYDSNTRLRVRAGKYAFTKEEGYGISNYLSQFPFITDVVTAYRNGSIVVTYNDPSKKSFILESIKNISLNDLYDGEPSSKELMKDLANNFALKLMKKVIKRYLFKVILPIPIRRLRLFYHMMPYIFDGISSLTSFRADVALLDASAIIGSLYKKEYKSIGSMLFLLSISDLLEEYTVQKTKNSLRDSLAINIDNVWLVNSDGSEVSYPLSQIQKGDMIKIRMGSIVPVDGKIVDGDAIINESSLTGESLPIHKSEGKLVHSGTVIEEGQLTIEVLSANDETRLSKIINLIEESEDLKASIQSKAEDLADSIVPYSLLTTLLTYLVTKDSTKALSVLMVDFSCAIKLATPISVISAMRESSDNRMMVRGGKHLESLANADTIVFDKTGTLTKALPKLVKIVPCGDYSRDEILKISACIEEHFAHSVARAIVEQAEIEGINHEEEHSEVEYIVAHGISTYYKDKKAIIGSYHFIHDDEGIQFTANQEKLIKEHIGNYSVIYLAIDGKLEGILCIDDPVRDEAKEVISELKDLGISDVVMLTGDSENSARTVAKELGIETFIYEVLPEEKADIINDLKSNGKTIIMVGDGINDSPALSAADVSVAMKNSSDIAREVADITLLSDSLYDLITIRKISEGMLNKINKNYRDIVLVNGSLIGLGIAGLIPPTTSSWIHNLFTMFVGARSTKNVLTNL